jgi:hypothetical protein
LVIEKHKLNEEERIILLYFNTPQCYTYKQLIEVGCVSLTMKEAGADAWAY